MTTLVVRSEGHQPGALPRQYLTRTLRVPEIPSLKSQLFGLGGLNSPKEIFSLLINTWVVGIRPPIVEVPLGWQRQEGRGKEAKRKEHKINVSPIL